MIRAAILGFSPEFITFEDQLNIVMPDFTRMTEGNDNDVSTFTGITETLERN